MNDANRTDSFLTSRQVMERYKISEVTLYRWERNERLNFPKPTVIFRRKLYSEQAIVEWERKRAAGAA